jgi:hypothetical protein
MIDYGPWRGHLGALLAIATLLLIPPVKVFATDGTDDCSGKLLAVQQHLTRFSPQYTACRKAKYAEYATFKVKRQRYLRLLDWANKLDKSLNQTIPVNAIQERDALLVPKIIDFEQCIKRLPVLAPPVKYAGQGCVPQLAAHHAAAQQLDEKLSLCRSCNIGRIGGGYAQSPVEILVAQDRDARTLRKQLYAILLDTRSQYDFSHAENWQASRDILLPRIQDIAHEYRASPRLVQMLERIQDFTEGQQQPDATTDRVMQGLFSLNKLLAADPDDAVTESRTLFAKLAQVETAQNGQPLGPAYFGFENAEELAGIITRLSSQAKTDMRSVIAAIQARYDKP